MKYYDTKLIANEFSRILREWLFDDEIEEIVALNREVADPNICHSHDFCDANEAMLEAMNRAGYDLFEGNNAASPGPMIEGADVAFNEAWEIAKRNEFEVLDYVYQDTTND